MLAPLLMKFPLNDSAEVEDRADGRAPHPLASAAVMTLALLITTGCGGAATQLSASPGHEADERHGAVDTPLEVGSASDDPSSEGSDADASAADESDADDDTSDASADAIETETAVTETEAQPDPAADRRAMMRRGKRAFEARCDTCHPGGDEDIGPKITGIRWPVRRMVKQIREGSGRMRPISTAKLSDADMDALMVYLARLGAVRGVGRE